MKALLHHFEVSIDRSIGRRNLGMGLLALIVIYFLWFPQSAAPSNYSKGVYISGFFWAILASSWALLAGVSGQFSFGHMAFMGIGAYTAGLLSRYGLSFLHLSPDVFTPLVAITVGTLMAGFIGLLVGWLLLRLRSSYLALFTIAFSELFRILMLTEFQVTNGMNGLSLRPLVTGEDVVTTRNMGYYIMFGLLVISLGLMYFVSNSRVGLFLRAMREDEDAASALGVNVILYKVLIFVFTSMIVGMAGGIFFSNVGAERITPETLEILQMSLVIAYAVVGGMESLLGAAAGAFISRYLLEWMRQVTITLPFGITTAGGSSTIVYEPGAWRYALFGVIVILTLRYARNGLLHPVIQWFEGRSSAMRETVSKRDSILEAANDNDTIKEA